MVSNHSSEQKKQFLCASYVRLSQDDSKEEESNSILNQKDLICDFIRSHLEFELVQEYSDDGYSGTNFNRPGFQEMIEDVKKGRINCIIVKDLSRFGRNYIETGRYLEQIFPFLGVRFISINDNLDTGRMQTSAEQFVLPFKNLINDSYCKDLSIKVRSQLAIKRNSGAFVGNFAPYGYKKDPANRNHLVIDQEASDIIRQIFEWKIQGLSANRIVDILNRTGIPCPMEYKRNQGYKVSTNFRKSGTARWVPGTILRILKNELYAGVMIQGKTTTPSCKMKQTVHKPESEWDRVEGTHEAIIPKGLFDTIQTMMLRDTRISPKADAVYLFSGFLYCADCKRSMTRRLRKYKDKEYAYYSCAGYRSHSGCTSHIISEKHLYSAVISAIQQQFSLIIKLEQLVQHVRELPNEHHIFQQFEIQLVKLDEQIQRNREMKIHLVESLSSGILSREEYLELDEIYNDRIQNCKLEKTRIDTECDRIRNMQFTSEWFMRLKKHTNIYKLDRRLLAELVNTIDIHSNKVITVHFKFEDQIKRMISHLELLQQELSKD